jgi:hypothetical protein
MSDQSTENTLHDGQKGGAYCPACKYYGFDCHTDPDEWLLPCDAFEVREVEEWDY